MAFVRFMGALAFVVLAGLFIGSPVFFGGEDASTPVLPESPVVSEGRPARPQHSPRPRPSPAPATAAGAPTRLANTYPPRCLRPAAAPPRDLVATVKGNTVRVTDLDGGVVTTIRDPGVTGPVAWSPSGRFLATGDQGLFWRRDGSQVLYSNGEFGHGMVSLTPRAPWAWSPIADCGMSIEEGTLYASTIDPFVSGTGIALIKGGVTEFAFEPNGLALRFSVAEGDEVRFYRADLATGEVRGARGFTPLPCRTCSPDRRFRIASRDQRLALLQADGTFLQYLGTVETENGRFSDRSPEWGPRGTGVLFIRSLHLISQVWFLPEGAGEPRYIADIRTSDTAEFDWSATPPPGRPRP